MGWIAAVAVDGGDLEVAIHTVYEFDDTF